MTSIVHTHTHTQPLQRACEQEDRLEQLWRLDFATRPDHLPEPLPLGGQMHQTGLASTAEGDQPDRGLQNCQRGGLDECQGLAIRKHVFRLVVEQILGPMLDVRVSLGHFEEAIQVVQAGMIALESARQHQ